MCRFFGIAKKNASITPVSPAEGVAGSATAVSFYALQADRNLSCCE